MREILFRGKRLDNDEWVEGSFCPDALEQTRGGFLLDGFIRRFEMDTHKMAMYEVDRETVGQYTGLTDKNGKRIFEGDVVLLDGIKGIVNYGTGCFCVKLTGPDYLYRNNPAIDIVLNEYPGLKVIGNIHDNPELLKDGDPNV